MTSGSRAALGAALQTDDQGRAVPRVSGVLVGYALEAATAVDQLIQILLK